MKILIAEDEYSIRLCLKLSLKKDGHEVTEVSDGDGAMKKLENNQFDLMIIDGFMPGKNSFEVIKIAKEKKSVFEIIFITGSLSEEMETKCQKLGVTKILSKPFSINQLKKLLGN
jgi:DNA-binding response OmpR family regulator